MKLDRIYEEKVYAGVLGKIIGGGLPVGAYGSSRKLMEMMAPTGSIYQAGTLWEPHRYGRRQSNTGRAIFH